MLGKKQPDFSLGGPFLMPKMRLQAPCPCRPSAKLKVDAGGARRWPVPGISPEAVSPSENGKPAAQPYQALLGAKNGPLKAFSGKKSPCFYHNSKTSLGPTPVPRFTAHGDVGSNGRSTKKAPVSACLHKGIGGEGGIRTHGTRKRTTVFETVPFDHSGTSPMGRGRPRLPPVSSAAARGRDSGRIIAEARARQ